MASSNDDANPCRNRKVGDLTDERDSVPTTNPETVWVKRGGEITLYTIQKTKISAGDKLDDLVITVAQRKLEKRFPNFAGFQLTLLQSKQQQPAQSSRKQIQIIHSRGNHWLVASTVFSTGDSVQVYDSAYSELDFATKDVITKLFSTASCELVPVGKQHGGNDCGLYAIAIATALAHTTDPATIIFDQAVM